MLTLEISEVLLEIAHFLTVEEAASTVIREPSTWLLGTKSDLGQCCCCHRPWGCIYKFDAWEAFS
jgi:hypothetical protein